MHCIFESWNRVDFKSSHNKKKIKISGQFYSRLFALILRENNASNLLGLKYITNGYKILLVNAFYFHLYNLWDYAYLVFLSLRVELRRITEMWISCIFLDWDMVFRKISVWSVQVSKALKTNINSCIFNMTNLVISSNKEKWLILE